MTRKGFIGTMIASIFGVFTMRGQANGGELRSLTAELKPMKIIRGEAIKLERESRIRLWTIGKLTDDPKTTIFPTKDMIVRLRQVLGQIKEGENYDLVWGPELTCSTHYGNVDKIITPVKTENGEVLYRIEKNGEVNAVAD